MAWSQRTLRARVCVVLWLSAGVACEDSGPLSERRIDVRASTAVLDFGRVPLGQARTEAVSLENLGGVAVDVSVRSPVAPPFELEWPERPVTLAPGSEVSIPLRFTPPDLGLHAGRFELSAADAAPLTVEVRGTGSMAIAIEPADLDFGPVLAGSASTATVAFRNWLAEPVTVTVAGLRGASERFDFRGGPLAEARLELAPMGEQIVAITYRPEPGFDRADSASVQFSACEAAGCRASLGVRGWGTRSAIRCTPEIDFGWLAIGAAASQVIACTNVSPDPVLIESASLLGSPRFSLPDGFPEPGTRVRPGASIETSIRVEGVEADVGAPIGASFQVRSRDAEGQELSLEETALRARVGPPSIDVVPDSLDFGRVAGETTLTRTVQVFNRGRSTLSILDVEPPEGLGLAVARRPTVIPPGGVEELSLAWTAETGVDLRGTVRIQNDDPMQPLVELPVRGLAGPPGRCLYRLEGDSIRFGSVTAFHQHTSFLALRNVGDAPCLVRTLPTLVQTDFRWADDNATFEVPPGARQLVMVDFRPTGLGRRSAQLPWYVSAPLGSDGRLDVEGSGSSRRVFVHSAFQDFGYIPDACGTITATLTIRNPTYEPIVVRSLRFSGDASFEFDDPGFPLTVEDESFRYITVRYTPGVEPAAFARYRLSVDGLDDIEGTIYAETGTATRATETFGPAGDEMKKLDVILQVSRANVPSTHLEQLRTEYESLRAAFDRLGVDYHIGHLSALGGIRRTDTAWFCPPPELDSGILMGRILPGTCGFLHETLDPSGALERYVTPSGEPSARDALARMLFAPTSLQQSPDENIERALSPPWVLEHNAGFLRSDANLLVAMSAVDGGVYDIQRARSLTYQLVHALDALMGREARFRVRTVSIDGQSFVGASCRDLETANDYRSVGNDSILTYPLAGGGFGRCREEPNLWGEAIASKFLPFHGHSRRVRLRQAARDLEVWVGGRRLRGGSFATGADWRVNPTRLEPFNGFRESPVLPYAIVEFSDNAQPSPTESVSISYTPSCVP